MKVSRRYWKVLLRKNPGMRGFVQELSSCYSSIKTEYHSGSRTDYGIGEFSADLDWLYHPRYFVWLLYAQYQLEVFIATFR